MQLVISSRFGRAGSSLLMAQLNNTFRAHVVGENGGVFNGLCESAIEMRATIRSRRWQQCDASKLPTLGGKRAWANTTSSAQILKVLHNAIARVFAQLSAHAHPRSRLVGFKEIRFEVRHLREMLAAMPALRIIVLTREPREHAVSLLNARHIFGTLESAIARVQRSHRETLQFARQFPNRVLAVQFSDLFCYARHQKIAAFLGQSPLRRARFERVLRHTARAERKLKHHSQARLLPRPNTG